MPMLTSAPIGLQIGCHNNIQYYINKQKQITLQTNKQKTNVVNNVYVRPTSRKQGIAKQMMIAVEDSLTKQKPSATLKLTVMSKNTPAVSLYKSLGFVAPGVYGALDAMPFNFLIEMEKKL